jgi:hypothetical protein
MVKASEYAPFVPTNRALSVSASAWTSRKPRVGVALRADHVRK